MILTVLAVVAVVGGISIAGDGDKGCGSSIHLLPQISIFCFFFCFCFFCECEINKSMLNIIPSLLCVCVCVSVCVYFMVFFVSPEMIPSERQIHFIRICILLNRCFRAPFAVSFEWVEQNFRCVRNYPYNSVVRGGENWVVG